MEQYAVAHIVSGVTLKRGVMVFAGADDVAVALQGLEDQLQGGLAHVQAVALSDRGQDVQDVAALLCIYEHRRKHPSARRKPRLRSEKGNSRRLLFQKTIRS